MREKETKTKPGPNIGTLLESHGPVPQNISDNPIESALYTSNRYAISPDEALSIRFAAIQEAFTYQFEHNALYREACDSAGFARDALKDPEDLSRVPLIPEHFFKGCPDPEQFIPWLTNIASDEIPWPSPGTLSGGYDEQITTLRHQHGLLVRMTSGSSGVPSFLPRNETTRRRSAHWKILSYLDMYPHVAQLPDLASVTLWPLDFSWADLVAPPEQVHALLDKKLGIETVTRAMSTPPRRGIVDRLLGRKGSDDGVALLEGLMDRLEEIAASTTHGILWAPPFLLYSVTNFVRERGRKLLLGEGWRVELGGGWKLLSQAPLSQPELKRLAAETLDIPPRQICDIYGSTECLGLCGISCEGGYKHIPHTVLHPLVLNEELEPMPNGEWGRFGFLNPLIQAYPGFIITGDRVRMLDQCPACDRPGPVLDPVITRMGGSEERGCANIVGEIISERIGGQ